MEPRLIKTTSDFDNLLLDQNDTFSKIANKWICEIQQRREQVIFKRLEELDIHINIEEEQKRVFKRFVFVSKGNEETILFNDGSIDGLRIITFVTKQTSSNVYNSTRCGFNSGYETTYY